MNNTVTISTKPFRSFWFWSVGTLALLLLLVAIAMPFVLKSRAIKHVEALGGEVVTEPIPLFEDLSESWQEWLRSSLGEGIQTFETATTVHWDASSISNDDLRYLNRFTNLSMLDIGDTQISDEGLSYLKGFTNLTCLDIHNTQISDAGLSHLKGLKKLVWLQISDTQISDAGLIHLKGLTNLLFLDISNTPVSKEGVAELQVALPDCKIKYSPHHHDYESISHRQ